MSKHKPLHEIEAGWDSYDPPHDGDLCEHYKGYKMKIVAIGFLEDAEVPCVIYRSIKKNTVWVRTAKNFLETVEHNGEIVPRFKRI